MVSDSQRHVDELLSEVKPLLKREGFHKTRLDWVRQRGDAFQCVNVQMMQGGWGFYINLGVIWPRS
ncbi:MAG: DUF4304 domain-containing protein, partial [Mycobacterium sp.]